MGARQHFLGDCCAPNPPLVVWLRNPKVTLDWQTIKLTLILYGITLAIYLVGHVFRTARCLDDDRAAETQEIQDELNKNKALIEQLMSPADRPRLVFERWGPIPADHPVAQGTEMVDGKGRPIVVFLQNGFHFINDGAPAYDVMVEKVLVGTLEARSTIVHRIGREGGFALIWLAQPQPLQSARSSDMWNLEYAMAVADEERGVPMYRADFSLPVSVTYRGDNTNVWYRSKAVLTYIRSQGRLEFGAITHEFGFLTRPS